MVDLLIVTMTWIHVLSAILYIGSALAFQFIFLPLVMKQSNDSNAQTIVVLGKRMGLAGQISSGLLVVTGLYLAFVNNILDLNALTSTTAGNILVVKVILFVVFAGLAESIAASLKKIPDKLENEKVTELLKKVQFKEYINLFIGFVIILLAVGLRFSLTS